MGVVHHRRAEESQCEREKKKFGIVEVNEIRVEAAYGLPCGPLDPEHTTDAARRDRDRHDLNAVVSNGTPLSGRYERHVITRQRSAAAHLVIYPDVVPGMHRRQMDDPRGSRGSLVVQYARHVLVSSRCKSAASSTPSSHSATRRRHDHSGSTHFRAFVPIARGRRRRRDLSDGVGDRSCVVVDGAAGISIPYHLAADAGACM